MSEMGLNSWRRVAMAAMTVSADQAWPVSAASVWRARTGVAATPPAPMEALRTTPSSMCRLMARHTAEMSSSKRLEILYTRLNSAPTLATACAALPPKGVLACLGRPGAALGFCGTALGTLIQASTSSGAITLVR